jgi:hypothetical protein
MDAVANKKPKPIEKLSDKDKHARLYTWFTQEMARQSANRFQMAMDEDYYDSEQWTQDEAAVVRSRGQNPVVYNETKSTIDWLIGTERRTRTDFTVQAREDSDDAEDDAKNKTKLLKYLHDVNRVGSERSAAADDVFKAGLGWIEIGISPDPEDEPLYVRSESWRNMLYDSLGPRRDLDDSRYVFRFRMTDLDLALAYFPKKEKELRAAAVSGSDQHYLEWWNGKPISDLETVTPMPGKWTMYDSDAWSNNLRERVMLIEAWYREPTTETTGKGSASIDRVRLKMRCSIMTEKDILMDEPSPYNHNKFPFIPLWCYRRKKDNAPYGVARPIRGPQDSLNKRMSKVQHILSSNQIMAETGAFDDEVMTAEEFREEMAAPDALGLLAKGGLDKVKMHRENDVAEAHIRLSQNDAAIIRNAAGVTNENLGRDTNATSGIAVQKKSEQGSLLTAEIFENMLFARQLEGEITLSLIEQYYNEAKVFAVTGERSKREYVKINQRDPVTGKVLNDITARKAMFIIGEQQWRQSLQQAAYESLVSILAQLAPAAPQIVTAMLDVVIELAPDLPNKQLIVRRIRSVTGMTDPDEKQTPEEMAAQQQREEEKVKQEEMQQGMLMLQLEEMKAKIQKLQSESGRVDAETIKAIVTASYEALQGAQIVSTIPNVAPVADAILTGAGYKDVNGGAAAIPTPSGELPELTPQDKHGDFVGAAPEPNDMNPAAPAQADGAQAGIETLRNDGTQPGE